MKNKQFTERKRCRLKGFTLIEIIVAMGIFVFAITVILTMMSSSGSTVANDARRGKGSELLKTCFREVDFSKNPPSGPSPVLDLPPINWNATPTEIEVFFDVDGKKVAGAEAAFYRCKLSATRDPQSSLGHLQGLVTWPARRRSGAPDGQVELFTSLLLP